MPKKKGWMQKAFPEKTRGKLHKRLGVPPDQVIPQAKLTSAYAKAKREGDTELMQEINAAKRGAAISKKHNKVANSPLARGIKGTR